MRNRSYSKHLFASPLLFLICMFLLFQGCKGRTADLPLKITICEGTQPIAGLVYVAYQEKFFEQQGLEVVLKPHSTGKACLGAVLDGKADLATVAETPIVLAGLEDKKFFVTATIHESEENTVVVARKDRGVVAPADLTGKKVGVTRGTNAQYMLDTLLTIHSIDTDTVEIVDLSPDEMFDALTGGQVDAVCTWNPHVAKLKSSLAEDATIFNGQGVYTETYNLVARQDFVRENSETIPKVLQALVAARKFVQAHPQRAQRIVAERIGMDESRLAELWDIYHFSVELDEAFLSMLDSQARWAVRERLTDRQTLPDFGVLIYLDGLREVDPSLVSIQE